MAAGAVQFVITDVRIMIDPVAQTITVVGLGSKYIVDDLGGQNIIQNFDASITYPFAGAGAKTLAQIKTDLTTALQAKYAALTGKTIS